MRKVLEALFKSNPIGRERTEFAQRGPRISRQCDGERLDASRLRDLALTSFDPQPKATG